MIPSVDIVIVNWNAGEYLYECVNSIKNSLHESFILKSVVVVDNASSDNSLNGLDKIELPIKIIRNDANYGFGKACNLGAFSSDGDYILILNPDTKLYEDSIHKPLRFLIDNEKNKIGMVGVQIVDDEGKISRNCARFPTPFKVAYQSIGLDKLCPKLFPPHFMLEWNHEDSREVDQVMGSFIIMPRSLFTQLNGYDDLFFVYYDDLDLSLRARKLGWKNYYYSEAKVYHKGGGTSDKIKATRLFYSLESKLNYCKKHFGKIEYYIDAFLILCVEPIVRIVFSFLSGSFSGAKETIAGYKKLYNKIFLNKR
ncbi:MAG: glycosyltransferase family 2 protein [Ignavibacteriales bacterium]|nr:glycosyltransferase family 2 protein [Ignavibacteriales bacterium]